MSSGGGSSLIAVVILLALIGGGFWYFLKTRGGSKQAVKTTWPSAQVIRQAVQEIGAERRWVVTGHTQDFVTFTRSGKTSWLLAFILLWFAIIPAILYLVLSGKSQTLTINVFAEPDGATSVQMSFNGTRAASRGRRFLASLPKPPEGGAKA